MHRLHSAMAFLALDITVDMPLMVKKDMLCHQIDLYPRRGRLRIIISVFLLYPRMICDDIFMTMKTFLHRGKSRKIGVSDIGMAIAALYFFYTGMHLMTEWNGLFGAYIHLPVCIEKIHKSSDKKCRAGNPE
jgi:hypothetical protein